MRACCRIAAVAVPAVLAAAAVSSAEPGVRLDGVRGAVERGSPGCRLVEEERLSMGRFKLWAVRRLVALSGEADPETREVLGAIRHVEVASYRTVEAGACGLPESLAEDLAAEGWQAVVRQRSADDDSVVLQHVARDGGLDGLLVIALDRGELEVVRIRGRIDRLLAAAGDAAGADAALGVLGLE